ncbi:MAG: transcription elongation factor GreA [Eubacteriales bacterium]|jgi:transcription elongation factor GreA
MAVEQTIITKEGKEKLEDELQYLKVEKRKEVAEKLKEARAQGDLSENAEYDAAKDEQAQMEGRIEEIEGILKNSVVADETADLNKVSVGRGAEVENLSTKQTMTFYIVGATEANSLEGKISLESPVGKALLNHEAGDTVSVDTPAGTMQFRINRILN